MHEQHVDGALCHRSRECGDVGPSREMVERIAGTIVHGLPNIAREHIEHQHGHLQVDSLPFARTAHATAKRERRQCRGELPCHQANGRGLHAGHGLHAVRRVRRDRA